MKPGVSTRDRTGSRQRSQRSRKSAALVEAAAVRAPASTVDWLATIPTARPSIRASPVTSSGAQASRNQITVSSSASASTTGRTSKASRSFSGSRVRSAAGSAAGSPEPRSRSFSRPSRRRTTSTAAASSSTTTSRTPLAAWSEAGPMSCGELPEPAAGDHRRTGHPEVGVRGGDPQVGTAGDHGVAREAAAGHDGDPRHDALQLAPQREGADVERGDQREVDVAGSPAAALGEEHRRQAHPADDLEEPVGLAVAAHALGAGHDEVVVGENRARDAVDGRRTPDDAVGRGLHDELGERPALLLGGGDEAPVLHERARVDEVGDVLPRRPPALRVPPGDLVRSRLVGGEEAAGEHLGEAVGGGVVGHGAIMAAGLGLKDARTTPAHP